MESVILHGILMPTVVTSTQGVGYITIELVIKQNARLNSYMCDTFYKGHKGVIRRGCLPLHVEVVSRGQTLFRTEGKGLGYGHRTVAPWSAYQSQHSIQSHDTWSMWLTGKFKLLVWVECGLDAWEVRWARSVLSHELENSRNRNRRCRKVASLTLVIAIVTSWLDLCD